MKKIIFAIAMIASTVAVASTEVYQFKSNIKIPVVAGSAKAGYYRTYVTSAMNGTLTVDADYPDESVVIEATIKKTGHSVNIIVDSDIIAILTGKKQNVAAAEFNGYSDDGSLNIACAGIGSTKVKVTGCSPCGDSTTCTRVTKLSGNLVGTYNCGCEDSQYATIDDDCEVDYEKDTDVAPIYGSWSIALKTVDGAKYK